MSMKFKAGDKVKVTGYDNGEQRLSPDFEKTYTVTETWMNDEESVRINFTKNYFDGEFIQCSHLELVDKAEDKRLTTSVSTFPESKSESAGKKYDGGKADLSILPFEQLEEVARILEFGAVKYGRGNFKDGIQVTRLLGASLRHIGAFSDGIDLDHESGQSHLAHAVCNLLFALYMMKHKPAMDNRNGESA